jgi:hypothetical protein
VSAYEKKRLLLASALFALAVGIAVARVGFLTEAAGVRLSARWVMIDFYSGAYYPVRALLTGENPHDGERFMALYPVADAYPPYLPLTLLIHLPFGLLPPVIGAGTFFVTTILLTTILAHLALRLAGLRPVVASVILLAALILLSRPGHWNLVLGQRAVEFTLATYVTLAYATTAPAIAGMGLAVALIKPTYGVPLALLLWAWGRRKTAALGMGLAALVNLPLLVLLAVREGGFPELIRKVLQGYHTWQGLPDVNPATSNTRTDAATLLSHFMGAPLSNFEQALLAAGVLLLSAAVIRLLAKNTTRHADALAVGIICLATSLIGYHRGYDLVLLSASFVAIVVPGSLPSMPRALRAALVVLFSILALNWIATESVLDAWQPSRPLWLMVTSVNGLSLVALFLAYLTLGARYHVRTRMGPPPRSPTPSRGR